MAAAKATKAKAPKRSAKKAGTSIAQSKAGLMLQKILMENGAIDVRALNELLATKDGYKIVAAGLAEERYSRIAKRRAWLTAKALSEDELSLITSLPEVLGQAPTILSEEEARDFSQSEVDLLVREELTRRQTEDILKGRYDAIRATAIHLVSFRNGGDPLAEGTVASPEVGYKFTVSKRGGKPNLAALEGVVDDAVWEQITDETVVVVREVNEQKLAEALGDGRVSLQQLEAAVSDVGLTVRFDPIKPGEDIS